VPEIYDMDVFEVNKLFFNERGCWWCCGNINQSKWDFSSLQVSNIFSQPFCLFAGYVKYLQNREYIRLLSANANMSCMSFNVGVNSLATKGFENRNGKNHSLLT
jgi:hypothetical protein